MKNLTELRIDFDVARDRYKTVRKLSDNDTSASLIARLGSMAEYRRATKRYSNALMQSTDGTREAMVLAKLS